MSRHACLNRVYSLAWNEAQQCFVPAPETTRRRGKRSSTVVAAAVLTLIASASAQAADGPVLPAGGRVVAGQATIGQAGNTTTIQQGSAKAAIDWQSFSIGKDASVKFEQPGRDSIALNRVVGQDPSQILGSLSANGQVFIVNPNGVLFAPGAQVSAAGVLASTRNLSNEDFLAGRYVLQGSGKAGVTNQGRIDIDAGGYVVLVGAQIVNDGTIAAPKGDVRLAAADQVTLQIDRGGLTGFTVDRGTLDALAANRGLIKADGGRIFLTADALDQLAKAVVNNEGVIEAQTVENHAGKIVLLGDLKTGTALVGGRLDASAPNGGDGGFVETSAAHVKVSAGAIVDTRALAGKTGTWLIDPKDFTIAATGGDITGTALGTALGSTNVTILSTSGASGTAGDVNVNDTVAWSANQLTLNAQNNINVNAGLSGSGTAQLALEYGQGAVAAGNASRYNIATGVAIDLPAGANFSTRLGSDGVATNYTVITALGAANSFTGTDLQGIQSGLSGNYALGADIIATATSSWNGGLGFSPLGSVGTPFTGNFDGLGHLVVRLRINRSGDLGLFGVLGATGTVSNLTMRFADVLGNGDRVGAVVGYNLGTLDNVLATGSVSTTGNQAGGLVGVNDGKIANSAVDNMLVGGNMEIGGLVGRNNATGTITNSSAIGTVSGIEEVGGLVGISDAPLTGLHASVDVAGESQAIGGLVGQANALVSGSTASGAVSGETYVGGLVGMAQNNIDIVNSSASGAVTGINSSSRVGGLVGVTYGGISGSHATGAVSGRINVGGLAGNTTGSVSDSYATGAVTGTGDHVGGLIGWAAGPVANSYATGNVSAPSSDDVGGLIGIQNGGTLTDSHATGDVTGANSVGGLVGWTLADSVERSHASGTVVGSGSGSDVGGLLGTSGVATITNVYATGDVAGGTSVGGLMGNGGGVFGPALLTTSYATGNVSGESKVGGLVGQHKMGGVISFSTASGSVTGTDRAVGGLVGRNNGTVTDVMPATGITQVVHGAQYTGGLVGENAGTVQNAVTRNTVVGDTGYVGGLVGYNRPHSAVATSSASGTVHGDNNVGGLVGRNDGGSITDSSATGAVTGTAVTALGHIGGLVGTSDGSNAAALITGSTSSGRVIGNAFVGGLVGTNLAGSAIAGSSSSSRVTASGDTAGGLVGDNAGSIATSQATGRVDGHDSIGGLVGLSEAGASISLSGSTGRVDGHDLVGGLVGTNSGTIDQSTASVGPVNGVNNVGGLVGDNYGPVTASSASGAVSGTSYTGGLVGYNETGASIAGSTATGTVTSSSDYTGGLVGVNDSNATISFSHATGGAVTTTGESVGGLVGDNYGAISDSTASKAVTSPAAYVGGLVGYQETGGTTLRSTASGNVSGGQWVGGLVGYNDQNATVTDSHATGNVGGDSQVGGLVGLNAAGATVATSTASGTVTAASGTAGGLVGDNYGSIAGSPATGAVNSTGDSTGGLVGINETGGTITTSQATVGSVTSTGDYTGGLVGDNYGSISDSSSSKAVTGGFGSTGGLVGYLEPGAIVLRSSASGNVAGNETVGGLVGWNDSGSITSSSATGTVSGDHQVGGLVGLNAGGSVTNASASGAVTATGDEVGGLVGSNAAGASISGSVAHGAVVGAGSRTGGLVGINNGDIGTSTADSAVHGDMMVGGLVGAAGVASTITDSSASGAVSETTAASGFLIGGLVGENRGAILRGTATGNVVGDSLIGGLVGKSYGSVVSSGATGSVTASGAAVGGLAGQNDGTVSLSQASGRVIAVYDYAGGLVGYNLGSIADSSASGRVTGASQSGGFVGYHAGSGSIVRSTSSGAVDGVSQLGGFVGSSGAPIADSNTSSTVLGSGSQLGGFAGYNESTLTHVTAIGNVTGSNSDQVGGLVGRHVGSSAVISAGSSASGQVVAGGSGQDVGGFVGVLSSGAQISGGAQAIGSVSGVVNVGGFVGNLDDGSITASNASGTVGGQMNVGGFAGTIAAGVSVTSSSASGSVLGTAANTGGFVGSNGTVLSGNAANGVHASGTVTGSNNTGGFAGTSNGTLSEITATHAVNGGTDTGGVVGLNFGLVERSHGANTVVGGTGTGGIAGENVIGTITQSYATGTVTATGDASGGVVGVNNGTVSIAYSTATVVGHLDVGGLVGNAGPGSIIANAYATGAVSGAGTVGGLIGTSQGSADFTYSSGAVTSTGGNVGGLIGNQSGASIAHSYFNSATTGQAHSAGDYAANGEVALGKTTAQMNAAATFAGWDVTNTGAHANVWRTYEGYAAPLLTYWLTPLAVTGTPGTSTTTVYDGTTHSTGIASVAFTETLAPGHLLGQSSAASGRNVGVYAATSGYWSDQQGYDITQPVAGSVTITPRSITGTLVGVTKTYDGTAVATLAPANFALTGFVAGEGAAVTQTLGSFNSRNVRDANSVSASWGPGDYAALLGTNLGNYTLPTAATGTASIAAKVLNVVATVADKTYDATTAAQLALSSADLVSGDSVALSGLATFVDKNAGTGKTVAVTGLATSGGDASNYVLAAPSITTTASIARRAITVSATGTDKVYDGSNADLVSVATTGILAGDQVGFTGTGTLADRNVGSAKAVAVSIAATGTDAGNYAYNTSASTTASVTPRSITGTLVGVTKTYDGTAVATLAPANFALTGFVAGEGAAVTQTLGSFNSRNVRDANSVSASWGPGDYAALLGTNLGNYTLPTAATGTASIAAKVLNVVATVADKTYDTTTAAQLALSSADLVSGDSVALSGIATFVDKNAGTGKTVAVTGLATGGGDASNYVLAAPSIATTASIARRAITVSATGTDKVYDGSNADLVSVAATGILAGDQVGFTGTGTLADRNVGSAKAVAVSIAATGTDAGNYAYNTSASTTASVTPRSIMVRLPGASKVADGSTLATLNGASFVITGAAPGDTLGLGTLVGSYDNAAIGSGKVVTVSLSAADYIAGAGTLLSNYTLVTGLLSDTIGAILPAAPYTSALVSLPNTPSGDSQAMTGLLADTAPNRTVERRQVIDPIAPAPGSVVSTNTKENLLFRRTFSIGDGGIRLPQGVRGSEKDAAQ